MVSKKLTVARSVLLACDKGLRVEEASIWASLDLINDIGLEVNVKGSGHVFARRSLREESAEATIVGRSSFHQTTVRLIQRYQELFIYS